MVKASTYTVTALEDKVGMRVDRYLADAIEGLSRSRIQVLIAAGWVTVDGAVLGNASAKVRTGQRFHVDVPAAEPPRLVAEEIPLTVVYEDADVVVVDKPAGLVVHPASGHPAGTLVNALLAHCGDNLSGLCGVTRPGIVHRLDKDTSGLIVAAKNDRAHAGLSEQFAAHSLERAYQALVWGVPRPAKGEISGNVGRSPANRKKMAVLARGGKPALTRYKMRRRVGTMASLVECRLTTGRTHQIRVHMANIGCPVVGDPLYGGGKRRLRGRGQDFCDIAAAIQSQALHAYLLGFRHPGTGKRLRFQSKLPCYFNILMERLDVV